MSVEIHPTAVVSEKAQLGENVKVGAFSLIGDDVQLGDNCIVHSHVVLDGIIEAKNNNIFFQFGSIGAPPQDLTYKNEPTKVIIGSNNVFREYVSVHRGTLKEKGETIIGDNNLLMAYVHLGHDVQLGSHCVLVNSVNVAGHVRIGDRVIISGGTNVSQFISMGRGSYIGGASAIDRDIPEFCTAYGNRVRLKGINIIGLRRQGFSKSVISEVVDFYRTMESSALSPRAFIEHEELMTDFKNNDVINMMVNTIRNSEVGIAPFMS